MARRLTPPWTIVDTGSGFRIDTADGLPMAWLYYDDNPSVGTGPERLTRDEARRVAANIIKLPALLGAVQRPIDGPSNPG